MNLCIKCSRPGVVSSTLEPGYDADVDCDNPGPVSCPYNLCMDCYAAQVKDVSINFLTSLIDNCAINGENDDQSSSSSGQLWVLDGSDTSGSTCSGCSFCSPDEQDEKDTFLEQDEMEM